MPSREDLLKLNLTRCFGKKVYTKPKKLEFFSSSFDNEIKRVYIDLGGILSEYPTAFRSYDIQCENFIVELDEERHFNRYRIKTLNSSFYKNYNYFNLDEYKKLCNEKEERCLKAAGWGKNWKNYSTENQFGISNEVGLFENGGSSRWKQRAFYDYLRDVSSKIMCVPIIRLSIWEKINGESVNQLINKKQFESIASLIMKRVDKI